jgi:hypothetical protein
LLPTVVAAQQEPVPARGLVLDEEGELRPPTPALAMQALLGPRQGYNDPNDPAIVVLRQTYEPRSAAELDVLVAEIAQIAFEGEGNSRTYARDALRAAAHEEGRGTPFRGALSALIRLHDRALERADGSADEYLFDLYFAGSEGEAYVVSVFEQTPIPPRCMPTGRVERDGFVAMGISPNNPCPNESSWCDAGVILHDFQHAAAPDDELLDERCGWGRWIKF